MPAGTELYVRSSRKLPSCLRLPWLRKQQQQRNKQTKNTVFCLSTFVHIWLRHRNVLSIQRVQIYRRNRRRNELRGERRCDKVKCVKTKRFDCTRAKKKNILFTSLRVSLRHSLSICFFFTLLSLLLFTIIVINNNIISSWRERLTCASNDCVSARMLSYVFFFFFFLRENERKVRGANTQL